MKLTIALLAALLLASCGSQRPPEWDPMRDIPISHPTIHYDCPVLFLDGSERVCWEESVTTKGQDD